MKKRDLKIGYMPLAHATYWKFFPQHLKAAMDLAKVWQEYLSQFGALCQIGKLIDRSERSNEARLAFQAEDVDVMVLATVTYSTPDDILLDLKRFRRPIIIWNTQASSAIPADMDFDKWMFEHGVTGVPGITNLLEREEMPYFLVSGHMSDPKVAERFSSILEAIEVAKRLWGARIGLFGHTYPGMIDFGYDPTMMYSRFGVETVPILGSTVLSAFQDAEQTEVDTLAKEVSEKYSFAHEFQGDEFLNSIRMAVAM